MDALRLMTSDTPTKNHDEIERLLSCPICLEVFTKPVVILPCQHNLCRECANDMYRNRGTPLGSGGRFKCPSCRREVLLDEHGVYGLQRNLLVENIVDMYQTDGRQSTFQKQEEAVMCDEHQDEKVNIYCTTCQKPTCSLCKLFGQHQECEVAPMEKIFKEQKTELSDAIALLASGNDKLRSIISQTESLAEKTEKNGRKVQSRIKEAFEQLLLTLSERKLDMSARAEADILERKHVLEMMLKNYKLQMENANKLMTGALLLAEERNISQFLKVSRETIEKALEVVSASEIRKPPFSIQKMSEFHIDFHVEKQTLAKLEFSPLEDDFHRQPDDGKKRTLVVSGKPGCDIIPEEDDVFGFEELAARIDPGDEAASQNSVQLTTNEPAAEELQNPAQSMVKHGRWYEMFVEQLPPPTASTAQMESSVHMKVVIPPIPDEDIDELKMENATAAESNVSEDTEDLDLEIEQLLASRRRRWSSRRRYSPRESPTPTPTLFRSEGYDFENEESLSPRGSPNILSRRRGFLNVSPSSSQTKAGSRRSGNFRSSSPSLSNHFLSKDESPSNKVSSSSKEQSKSTTQRNVSSAECELGRKRDSSSKNDSVARQSRVYCTHKRRTWSHLLDKK